MATGMGFLGRGLQKLQSPGYYPWASIPLQMRLSLGWVRCRIAGASFSAHGANIEIFLIQKSKFYIPVAICWLLKL
jgi:hypothetical protein